MTAMRMRWIADPARICQNRHNWSLGKTPGG
jgi:hypothetical protein